MQIRPLNSTDDVVTHTVRHFVAPATVMDQLPPVDALSGSQARWKLVEAHVDERQIDAISAGGDALDRRWWGVSELIRVIHDQGYAPRYLAQARQAGQPGARGSWWRRERKHWGAKRVLAQGVQIVLFADWRSKAECLQMVSAYARPASPPSAAPLEDDYLARLYPKLKKWR